MFRLISLFALVSCAFAGTHLSNDLDGRIVNGENTTIEAHPYQVSLQKSNSHLCGGSIIDSETVVTAAHCVTSLVSLDLIKVRAGSTEHNKGGDLVRVRAIKYHEGYNSTTKDNDVAIVKLDTPIRESRTVRYIKLAEETPKNGTKAIVTGWGTKCFLLCISLPTILQRVEVNIIDQSVCKSNDFKYGSQIKDSMVCAHALSKDACQGDSGGPLVAENRLVGIVSWGNGCARKNYPGVYCDVNSVREWIVKTSETL